MLRKERLERLIAAIDSAMKGEMVMAAFDNKEYEQYRAGTQARRGRTDAWQEYAARTNA